MKIDLFFFKFATLFDETSESPTASFERYWQTAVLVSADVVVRREIAKKEFGTVVFAQLPCQRQEITESLLRRIVGAVDATTQENVLGIESTTTWNVVVVFTQTTRRQQ